MITNEMKAKIFALYLGCDMVDYSGVPFPVRGTNIESLLHGYSNTYKLILKPLSEITDEDAIHICKMGNGRLSQPEDQLVVGRQIAANMVSVFIEEPFLYNYVEIIDFLRSKGYALPYMGIDLFESSLAIPKQ